MNSDIAGKIIFFCDVSRYVKILIWIFTSIRKTNQHAIVIILFHISRDNLFASILNKIFSHIMLEADRTISIFVFINDRDLSVIIDIIKQFPSCDCNSRSIINVENFFFREIFVTLKSIFFAHCSYIEIAIPHTFQSLGFVS